MSDINLYTLSNKIRTILLTTIDKEIFASSKQNYLLINSQTQDQLTKKFVSYRDFTIESEESFEGAQNNEDNNMCYDLRYNYSHKKYSFYFYSSNPGSTLISQNFITKSLSPKKNSVNQRTNKTNNLEISENNICKLNIDSGKKIRPKMKPSFSCNEIIDFKTSVLLRNSNKKHQKKFSADLYINSTDDKSDDCSQLINYCYKLKKPNDEIINEKSGYDNSINKENKKNLFFLHRIKNNHRNFSKKKLKKIINKKKIDNNRNSISNFEEPLMPSFEKNLSNEKSNSKEKVKTTQNPGKKSASIELKEIDTFHWKNILQLNHRNSGSSEKKTKEKKLEQPKKSSFVPAMIKKSENKKLRHFKSIDITHLILKHKEKKEKREKKEKNNASVFINVVNDTQFQRKYSKISKILCKINDEFQQNDMSCFGKKFMKTYGNERNERAKNERKSINISYSNYNNKFLQTNNSIDNKQNLKKKFEF